MRNAIRLYSGLTAILLAAGRLQADTNTAGLWDIHTDDTVVSRAYRRIHYGEA